jgi:hypothetical protein
LAAWESVADFEQAATGNERPARGDSRTGQAIWALGWMGARAEYGLDGGGIVAPTVLGRGRAVGSSNRLPTFFQFISMKLARGRPARWPANTKFSNHPGAVCILFSRRRARSWRLCIRQQKTGPSCGSNRPNPDTTGTLQGTYDAGSARLIIFSPCSFSVRVATPSFVSALWPN